MILAGRLLAALAMPVAAVGPALAAGLVIAGAHVVPPHAQLPGGARAGVLFLGTLAPGVTSMSPGAGSVGDSLGLLFGAAIGVLVREQMDRLTDEKLVALIRDRVGDDLDWIRINGTLVGGTIGLAIYLTVHFLV